MVKNMLILMDDTQASEKLLDCSLKVFNSKINQYNGAFIAGVCGNNLTNLFSDLLLKENQYTRREIIDKIFHTNTENSDEFISRFIDKCDALNLITKVFFTGYDLNYRLFNESIYHDIFLVSKDILDKTNFEQHFYNGTEELLSRSKCPLLILDTNQTEYKNIVLLYDGSKKSFEAIKMFLYLMNHLLSDKSIRLHLVCVVNSNSLDQEKYVINYISKSRLNFSMQHIFPESYYIELMKSLKCLNNFILVSGVNKFDIIADLVYHKKTSLLLKLPCSIFLT